MAARRVMRGGDGAAAAAKQAQRFAQEAKAAAEAAKKASKNALGKVQPKTLPMTPKGPPGAGRGPGAPGAKGTGRVGVAPGVPKPTNQAWWGGEFIDDGIRFTYPLPQGVPLAKFEDAARLIRSKAVGLGDDVVVQGSRAAGTAKPTSDIDFALRVSPEKFDELVKARFGKPNPGSAKEKTMLHAIETGKIQAGEAGLRPLRKELQEVMGMEVDISIIRKGGPFDNPPTIPIP